MTPPSRQEATVLTALEALGIEAVELVPLVAADPWTRWPRAWRTPTTGGSTVKVRLARRAKIAARSAALSEELHDVRVPPPLGRLGRVTVERWVEGIPLSSPRLRGAHVDAAADLLASIHAFPGRGGRLPRRRALTSVVDRCESQLAELAAAGTVPPAAAAGLVDIVRHGLPPVAGWGLVHGDFCGENLVCGPDGTLVSVDHELLGHGFFEYDLARSWYRWPAPSWAHERFENRYRAQLALPPGPQEAWRAWRVVAAVKGVHLRRRRGAPSPRALAALERLGSPSGAGPFRPAR